MAIDFATIPSTPSFDDQQSGPGYVWWFNGTRAARTGGTFYTNREQLSTEPSDPWVPSTRFENEDGFETQDLRLAIIGYRQQAFRKEDDRRVYLDQWVPGAQLHTEVLALAEGIEAPIVWSCKGLTGKAVTGKTGIIPTYRNTLLRDAERTARRKLPLWAFWLPISTQLDAQGRVTYVSTGFGNNVITPPALHVPGTSIDQTMEELFVGNALIELGADLRGEYDTWLKQRRGTDEPHTQPENEEIAPSSSSNDDTGDPKF
jgi:hypothetical protein